MTISKDDEREAREWLREVIDEPRWFVGDPLPNIARTILALLDRPVMPKPEEVPDDVWDQCVYAERMAGKDPYLRVQAVHRVLHDWRNKPAEPVKVEAWGIAAPNGEIIHVRKTEDAARQRAKHCPDDVLHRPLGGGRPMTDLAKTIKRVKGALKMPPSLPGFDLVARADLTALLDAAKAAATARDAALEEAAQIAENACLVPPDGGSPTDAEREMCEEAARLIRKRKGAA